ncbi:MAG: carboxypeptidase regulatory-like domain-containing protein [Terriglobales bacterium]
MFSRSSKGLIVGLVTFLAALFVVSTPSLWAQHGTEGKVVVTVLDQSGSVVQGAQLELRDLATNDVRKGETQGAGTYSFVNLSLGTYKLTISKAGFKTQAYDSVVVEATKTTDISASLKVGAISETVEVTGGTAPLVETTSSAIGTVVDLKQVEDLPIDGRDLGVLATLVPGYSGTFSDGGGTFNGLPSIAQGSNIDGVIGSPSRMKFGGNGPVAEPVVEPRVEDIAEMAIQTDQLDLNQGFGTSSMQVNFITRRGTNAFHGRLYEDFRNSYLNANSWYNDYVQLPKNHLILNEFGGSVGGPIIKDKLFFFGTFAMSKRPGGSNTNEWIPTSAAQQGNFTYIGTDNVQRTVNVLTLAGNCFSAGNCGPTALPTAVNGRTYAALQADNGILTSGVLNSPSDPNFQNISWLWSNPETRYFPTVRVDFNPNAKARFNIAWNYTKTVDPTGNAPNLPGAAFAKTGAGNQFKSYTAALGFDYTLSPTMVNELRGGFLYNGNFFAYNGVTPTPTTQQIGWNFPNLPYGYSNTAMNGTNFQIPTGSYYPVFNASDTLTWQHRAHTLSFGFSWWREQNHYYNGVLGFPAINLGLTAQDPAINAFTSSASSLPAASGTALGEAQELYAVLAGRVSGIGGSYFYDQKQNAYCEGCIGAYNLDEVQKAWGLFVQDSYRIKPSLTLNYGLRWDFVWPDYDVTNAYHSALNAAIWGPSGPNNLFNPGSLKGTNTPTITQNSAPATPKYVLPQPAIGIAWNPKFDSGPLNKLTGGDKTVIRLGFSLRNFTEPQQYFWNQASDYASFYFQGFGFNPLQVSGTQPAGTYAPGALSLGSSGNDLTLNGGPIGALSCSPAGVYVCNPATYRVSEAESDFTFIGGPGVNGVGPNIKQPYTESWNLGIQRQLSETKALEIRYVGNRSLRQWITIDPNEVNIFENGFLPQFKQAQTNLAAYEQATGCNLPTSTTPCSFANHSLAGQGATPVFDAAFAGEAPGPDGSLGDYTNGGYVGQLQQGAAGGLASTLANTAFYFCNMVGSANFGPCLNNANLNDPGPATPYPINNFQVNPYAIGTGFTFSQLVAEGYSNYNSLQVDFRQRQWHGLQFDANYTWAHTLGISTANNWQGAVTSFTLRNMRLSYGPTLFDIRHAVNANGTYDLPFGKGKPFANRGGVVDRIVGGWTLGSIFTFQTGNPFLLQGGYSTFNDYADGGVVLNGVTPAQLQSSIGVYHIPNQPLVDFINPKYLANSGTGGGANLSYITANTTPGIIAQRVWLHGPRYVNDDLSISKHFAITERFRFSLQAEMLNAFNHPSFQAGSGAGCSYGCYAAGGGFPNVQAPGFGIGGLSPSYLPRRIELRGNVEF